MNGLDAGPRRALITGGDSGIGEGIARALAESGTAVCIVGRNVEALASVQAEIRDRGGACDTVVADLATTAGAQSAADAALAIDPTWDVLVNDAGNPAGPMLLDINVELWDLTMAVHVRAPFILARSLVPGMIAAGGGKILNVSSVAGMMASASHGAYSAAKAGLNMLTRCMAIEWGKHNIQANAICPTATQTQLLEAAWRSHPAAERWFKSKIPAGRLGDVSDLVSVAAFLLSPDSDFISGAVIPVDGGMSAGFGDLPVD